MSDEPQVTNLTVSGGAGSAEANLEDLLTLARQREGLAAELKSQATHVAAVAADSDLDAAAFLDPIGVGIVRDMLTEALTGPTGLFTMSTVMGDQARQVQAVHDYTVESDATQADLMQGVMWGLGRTGLAVPGMAADVFLQSLFDEVGGIFEDDPPPTSFDEDPQAWLLAHPGFINRWGEALPGLIGLPPGFQNAALIISSKWPDGRPVAALNPDPDPTTIPTQAPADLGDLMTNLAGRNRQATANHDEIDIQQITQADGTIAYIVNIPGTKTSPRPRSGR